MPRTVRDTGRKYRGREDKMVLSTTLSPDTDRLLRELLPEGMTISTFLTALIHDYRARMEERTKCAHERAASAVS